MHSSVRCLSTILAIAILPAPVLAGGLIDRFGAPVWEIGATQPATLFGFSATTAGDVDGDGYSDVIVGAGYEDSTLTDEGAAYLYRGSSHGSALAPAWVFRGRQVEAHAGLAVAPAGDVNHDGYADVLIAVPYWDTQANADAGKVVVFHGGPNGLSTTPAYELFSPTPAANQHFGISVAPAGDVNGDGYADVLVGSELASGGFDIGAAYLFEGGVGGLFATPAMTMLGFPGADSQMGKSLSTAGDINGDGFADFIVGSPGDSRTLTGAGAAYVFTGKAVGAAELDTLLKGTVQNVALGRSVSVAGDVNGDGYSDVIIGVPQFGTNFPGKAVIGFGGPLGIATVTDLLNPEAPANEFTGLQVSTLGDINGDGLADVGVVSRDATGTNRGRISVYFGARGTGPQYFGEILTHGSDGFFGNCLATSGDTDGDGFSEILVGTEDVSVVPGQHEGVAYQFKAPRNGLRLATGGWPRLGGDPGTGYGSAVAVLSRFNASDTGKLIIGDPQFGGKGRVSVHSGSETDGVNFPEDLVYGAATNFQSFGAKIVDAGDTNGDSYSDYAVSATTLDDGSVAQAGAVFLYPGASGAPPPPSLVVTGASDFDRVGSALAGRGDVNGDGYHDLLIGAREWDEPGKADCGKVFLYFGGAGGLLAAPPWTLVGSVAGQGLGAGVALCDFDGDGYTDVIVGSSSPTFEATAPGKVEIYFGGASGPSSTPGVVLPAPVPEVSFGLTVAALGDVTGDGIADLGIGAPRENNRGVARIYQGNLGRAPFLRATQTILGTQDNARFGAAMAGGGDVDGDGIGDFVIGEPGWDGGQTDEGRFGLYYGARNPNGFVPATVIESNIVGATLGASFAPFRDINIDGFADVVVGAPGATGRVYPFAGGGTFGRRLEIDPVDYGGAGNPRALHPGRSHQPNQVAAYFYENTAGQGRSRLGFDVEIKPLNQAFDGVPTSSVGPSTFDSGPPLTQSFAFTISTLNPPLPGRTLKLRGRWTNPNPLFPRTRWVTPEAHTSGDHDVWITGTAVAVGDLPGSGPLRIEAVAPNPSLRGGASVVSFTTPQAGRVTLDLFDVRGARVRSLLDELRPAGVSSIAWDGKDDDGRMAATGVYMLVLESGRAMARAKLVRLP